MGGHFKPPGPCTTSGYLCAAEEEEVVARGLLIPYASSPLSLAHGWWLQEPGDGHTTSSPALPVTGPSAFPHLCEPARGEPSPPKRRGGEVVVK